MEGRVVRGFEICLDTSVPVPAPSPGSGFEVLSGACTVSGSCVRSPNYPGNYGNYERCSIAPRTSGALSVNGHSKATQLAGWKSHPNSMMANTSLAYNTISRLHFDGMHIWCADGIVVREVKGLVAALKAAEPPLLTSLATLATYLSRWRWPRQRACAAETMLDTG